MSTASSHPDQSAIRVLVLGKETGFVESMHVVLGSEPDVALTLQSEEVEALGRPTGVGEHDVVIVHLPSRAPERFQILAHYTQRNPGVSVVLATPYKDPDMMVLALRSGVKEFLFEPYQEGEVATLVRRLGRRQAAEPASRHGTVLAFMPCKGGSGATFLAANVAHALAAKAGKKVLFIDLNLQFGDAYLFLMDRQPVTSLADVCGSFARLDKSFLESAVAKLPSGLRMLPAPASPTQAELVKPEHIEAIVDLARSHYDCVVLDVGRHMDAVVLKALDVADHVYPVLQPSLPYLRDAQRMQALFKSLGYVESKVRWIVNRGGGQGSLGMEDVNRVVGDVYWTIPNDHKHVDAAVNQGIPVVDLAAHSAVAKAVGALAHSISGDEVNEKSGGGLFGLFRRR